MQSSYMSGKIEYLGYQVMSSYEPNPPRPSWAYTTISLFQIFEEQQEDENYIPQVGYAKNQNIKNL